MRLVSTDIGAFIGGVADEDDDLIEIHGPEELEGALEEALGAPSPKFFGQVSRMRGKTKSPKVNSAIKKLATVAKQVQVQSGRIEAEWLRRPNTLVSVYTPTIASGATSTFSVQPGTGTSYYRFLGMTCSDEQSNLFGFSSLKVGGQEHVNFTQSTPSAPVSSAVPWAGFALREGRQVTNLAPWSGQLFDPSQPITGTIVNLTVAASGDALTVAARLVLNVQTDPCGMRYQKVQEANDRMFGSMKQALGIYAPMIGAVR